MNPRAKMFAVMGSILLATFLLAVALARWLGAPPLSYAPSTFNASPAGTKALFVTLQKLGYTVQGWQHPWTKLAPENGVLIHTDVGLDELMDRRVQQPPFRAEYAQLSRWVARGNTVIVYTSADAIWQFSLEALSNETETAESGEPQTAKTTDKEPRGRTGSPSLDWITKRTPDILVPTPLPGPYTRGVHEVAIADARGLKSPEIAVVPLIEGPDKALYAVWIQHGKGRVVLFSTPSFIDNEHCGRQDNLALVLNILSRLPAGGTILFDEYHHGYSQEFAMGDFLSLPMVKAAALQLALVIGLLIYSSARRFGEPVPLVRDTRRSVMEYTVSLGDLYARAATQLDALDYLYGHLRRTLADRYGLRPDASAMEIGAALGTAQETGRAWEQLAAECERRLKSRQLTRRQFALLARQIQQLRSQL